MNKKMMIILLTFILLISGCTSSASNKDATNTPTATIETTIAPTIEATIKPSAEPTITPSIEPTIESSVESTPTPTPIVDEYVPQVVNVDNIAEYNGQLYITVFDNEPNFNQTSITTTAYEDFSDLDSLGRVGIANACLGVELMPTEDRESISEVYPTGFINVGYESVDGGWLYNRSHMIGFQLSGENANELNLMTGTRSFNVDGMLPFENMVADYIKETNNHVMYRVTPIFKDDELVARGIQLEAYSVEDEGEGISFNVYIYNNEPSVIIDYQTGKSEEIKPSDESTPIPNIEPTIEATVEVEGINYILNTNTDKFHYPSCSSVDQMSETNKKEMVSTREQIINMGYDPCGRCDP